MVKTCRWNVRHHRPDQLVSTCTQWFDLLATSIVRDCRDRCRNDDRWLEDPVGVYRQLGAVDVVANAQPVDIAFWGLPVSIGNLLGHLLTVGIDVFDRQQAARQENGEV